ncbi:MAG: hypothetical protein ABI360_09265 [Allobranchiibius sp.]
MAPSQPSTGVLYLRGDRRRVDAWVRRGSAPCFVVPYADWTAVVPSGPVPVPPPYDEAHTVLASRGVPSGMRSAIGLFDIDGRIVLTVHPVGWRAITRWLIWEPGRGIAAAPHLQSASSADLVRAAGVDDAAKDEVRAVLADRSSAVADLLGELVDILELPGDRLALGRGVKSAPGSTLVEPDARSVRDFERVVQERKEVHDTLTKLS